MIMLRNRRAAVENYKAQMRAKYGPSWSLKMLRIEANVLRNRERVLRKAEQENREFYNNVDTQRRIADREFAVAASAVFSG